MASERGVLASWKLMETSGLQRPWSAGRQLEDALAGWVLVLGDLADEQLVRLTIAWLRSPDAAEHKRFNRWPVQGTLLELLGDGAAVGGDEAWGQAMLYLRRRGVLHTEATPALIAETLRCELEHAERIHAAALAMGGWVMLGHAEEDHLAAHRASFRGAWNQAASRRVALESADQVQALLDSVPQAKRIPGVNTNPRRLA